MNNHNNHQKKPLSRSPLSSNSPKLAGTHEHDGMDFSVQDDQDGIQQLDGAIEHPPTPQYFPFECNTCHQEFADPDDFIVHDSYPFKCDVCRSCFPVQIAIDLHKCQNQQNKR